MMSHDAGVSPVSHYTDLLTYQLTTVVVTGFLGLEQLVFERLLTRYLRYALVLCLLYLVCSLTLL